MCSVLFFAFSLHVEHGLASRSPQAMVYALTVFIEQANFCNLCRLYPLEGTASVSDFRIHIFIT